VIISQLKEINLIVADGLFVSFACRIARIKKSIITKRRIIVNCA